jgi:2-methylcitrate dehydratase PrpD
MRRVDLSVDPELDAAFPGQRAARVLVQTHDGREGRHLQPTRKGDPEQPLTDAELDEKFLELACPVAGDAAAKALLQRLWALERIDSLATLTA